jgi:hypothetical protein
MRYKMQGNRNNVWELDTEKLCQWLLEHPHLHPTHKALSIQVVKKECILGVNFLECTQDDWERWTLPGGVAKSLVQIAKEVSSVRFGQQLLNRTKRYYTDGIDLSDGKYLDRDALLEEIIEKLKGASFVIISSPPATGKTALLELLNYKYKLNADYYRCLQSQNSNLELINQIYANFEKRKSEGTAPDPYYIFLDDAQNFYDDSAFWEQLIKVPVSRVIQFRFVICATHLLSTKKTTSPIEFSSFPRLEQDKLRISDNDAYKLIDLRDFCGFSLKTYSYVKYTIVKQAAGVIGAIVLSVYKISEKFRHFVPQESEILEYFLSVQFSSEIGRLFGADISRVNEKFGIFLKRCFMNNSASALELDDESIEILDSLVKGGVLIEVKKNQFCFCFASELAKRFFFHRVFPTRKATTLPRDIFTLVKSAIKEMSSSALMKSLVHPSDFPKEAVFQHEFFSGLVASLPPSCYICAELSKIFPNDDIKDGKIEGEIDFYINGDLRWGLELLTLGDNVTEHLDRFSAEGKYYPLQVNAYAIVDFRRRSSGKPTNVLAMENRVTVFFPHGDYSVCVCRFEIDPAEIFIKLSS